MLPDQFDDLLVEQGGGCYVCGCDLNTRNFCVDHDHRCCPNRSKSCGRCVLGLLCKKCNTGFGMFNDDSALMIKAAVSRQAKIGSARAY